MGDSAPEPSVNIHRWAVAAADASAVIEAMYGVEGTTLGLVALTMGGRRSAPTVHLTDEVRYAGLRLHGTN